MNSTGCAAGLASDELFQRAPLTCDTSVSTFWAVTLSLAAYRATLVVLRAATWRSMHRNHAGRWSLTPTLSAVIASSYAVFVPLGGLNLVNFAEGSDGT